MAQIQRINDKTYIFRFITTIAANTHTHTLQDIGNEINISEINYTFSTPNFNLKQRNKIKGNAKLFMSSFGVQV